jgi:putative transposase
MARQERIVLPGLPHHVVVRGNNRRLLFSSPDDYTMFLCFLARAIHTRACRLHALTLMSNHAHLLMTPADEDDLSACVKSFCQRYAQYRNKKRDASGKLFEQRYFSRPVLDERQVAIVTSYIHANPIRSGQVKDAMDYRWTTHALHAGQPDRSGIRVSLWTPTAWWLDLGADWAERGRAYLPVFDDCLRREVEPEHVSDSDILEAIEALSNRTYALRLRRPNGRRAR